MERERQYRKMAARGKYRRLYTHLCSLTMQEWRTTFSEVETIIGFGLPPSARLHRPWWSNQSGRIGHSQALAWAAAGWETAEVDYGCRDTASPPQSCGFGPQIQSGRSFTRTFRWGMAGRSQSQTRGYLLREKPASIMYVDTNVLVKARFLEAPDHEAARSCANTWQSSPDRRPGLWQFPAAMHLTT